MSATGRGPVDPKQPPALPLLGGGEATEGEKEKRRQEREKKLEFPVDRLLVSCHRCLLFGVYSKKGPLPQAGGQAHSSTIRARAPGHHPSLTSPAPMSKDHTTGR